MFRVVYIQNSFHYLTVYSCIQPNMEKIIPIDANISIFVQRGEYRYYFLDMDGLQGSERGKNIIYNNFLVLFREFKLFKNKNDFKNN